jgi:GNAT superfamily N-acetyltransferase
VKQGAIAKRGQDCRSLFGANNCDYEPGSCGRDVNSYQLGISILDFVTLRQQKIMTVGIQLSPVEFDKHCWVKITYSPTCSLQDFEFRTFDIDLYDVWRDGEAIGYALFFGIYSTLKGCGIFLEDLYVREAFRGRGIGRALLCQVARIARQEGSCGVCWEVLAWNDSAIKIL